MENSDLVLNAINSNYDSNLVTNFNNDITNEDIDLIIQSKVSNNMKQLKNFICDSIYISSNNDDNVIDQYSGKKYKFPSNAIGKFFEIINKCRKEKQNL